MGLITSFPGGNGGGDFDFENYQPTFTEASTRANIASGEKNSVILGKLKKWYTDLKAVAFSGNASDITPDSAHRFVTDTEKSTWNAKQNALTAGNNVSIVGSTISANASGSLVNNYTTTEQRIGTWVDGKPVYQKTFALEMPTVSVDGTPVQVDTDITSLNIKAVVSISGQHYANYGLNPNAVPLGSVVKKDGNILTTSVNVTQTGKIRLISDNTGYNGRDAEVTLQYTKTTD